MTLKSAVKPRIELPLTALQEVDGKSRVWVIDAQTQTVSPRDVSIVSRTHSTVVLANDIKAGERVVSAGVNSLKPGQKVRVDEGSPQ